MILYYLFLWYSFLFIPGHIQKGPSPFKVLYTDSATINERKLTRAGPLPDSAGTVNTGHLILLHDSGNLIEFNHDSREADTRYHELSPISVEVKGAGPVLSPCNAGESIEWLQLAIWLEYHGFIMQAHSYYTKAAEGSTEATKAFYKEILQSFKLRNNF